MCKSNAIDFSKQELRDRNYTVRLEPSVYRKIKQISDATGTTMSSVIRTIIKHGLGNMDGAGQPTKSICETLLISRVPESGIESRVLTKKKNICSQKIIPVYRILNKHQGPVTQIRVNLIE